MHSKSAIVVLLRISVLLITALGIATRPARGQAGSYTLQTLDVPGASFTSASGINNSGQVVGTYCLGSTCHGFVSTQGQFAFVDAPNANSGGTFVSGISNSGVVVGSYISALDGKTHGFSGSQFADIVFPSTDGVQLNTWGNGINTAGQVVGFYQSDRYMDAIGYPLHGFELTGGSFAQIDFPGAAQTVVTGINDAGQIVGDSFLFSGGSFSTINFPGSASTTVAGINNGGVVTGGWTDSAGHKHGFVLARGTFTSLDFPGAISTTANGINDGGDIVGGYTDANGQGHGFITNPISLVDPVPDLLSGSSVMTPNAQVGSQTGAQLLATKGTVVQGVAADGVAEVVVRIMARNVGDQFTLTLVNDQGSQIIPNEDGALGNPGDTSFSQGQITVTAVASGNGPNGPNPPFAFAIYRAPVDFARPITSTTYKTGACAGLNKTDDQLACRSVSLQIQGPSGNPTSLPIIIVRPPVILIHGLWDNWSAWNNFGPLVTGRGTVVDSRFSVGRVSYDAVIGTTIIASDPFYSSERLNRVQANSIGFQYNAPSVLAQIEQWIGLGNFRGGKNPANIPVAAVQADIVAHSMGGDIARTLVLQPTFLNDSTFGEGNIHKVITIDTPHLGSPLAIQLLSSQENGGCLQGLLADEDKFTLSSVVFSDGSFVSGAVADLQGDDTTGALSDALSKFNSSAAHPLPISMIAGVYQNFAALDSDVNAIAIRNWGFGCPSDPLAQQLTSTGWPPIFHNNPNDAIVSENSQLNGLIPSPGSQFFGYVHSPGTEKLGFAGPSVIDAGPIPNQVIYLLNTPASNTVYYNMLNP